MHAPGSMVMVVGSHADYVSENHAHVKSGQVERLLQQLIERACPQPQPKQPQQKQEENVLRLASPIHVISTINGQGLHRLLDAMVQAALDPAMMPHCTSKQPKSDLLVRAFLAELYPRPQLRDQQTKGWLQKNGGLVVQEENEESGESFEGQQNAEAQVEQQAEAVLLRMMHNDFDQRPAPMEHHMHRSGNQGANTTNTDNKNNDKVRSKKQVLKATELVQRFADVLSQPALVEFKERLAKLEASDDPFNDLVRQALQNLCLQGSVLVFSDPDMVVLSVQCVADLAVPLAHHLSNDVHYRKHLVEQWWAKGLVTDSGDCATVRIALGNLFGNGIVSRRLLDLLLGRVVCDVQGLDMGAVLELFGRQNLLCRVKPSTPSTTSQPTSLASSTTWWSSPPSPTALTAATAETAAAAAAAAATVAVSDYPDRFIVLPRLPSSPPHQLAREMQLKPGFSVTCASIVFSSSLLLADAVVAMVITCLDPLGEVCHYFKHGGALQDRAGSSRILFLLHQQVLHLQLHQKQAACTTTSSQSSLGIAERLQAVAFVVLSELQAAFPGLSPELVSGSSFLDVQEKPTSLLEVGGFACLPSGKLPSSSSFSAPQLLS